MFLIMMIISMVSETSGADSEDDIVLLLGLKR
jgi:hypothetical protein